MNRMCQFAFLLTGLLVASCADDGSEEMANVNQSPVVTSTYSDFSVMINHPDTTLDSLALHFSDADDADLSFNVISSDPLKITPSIVSGRLQLSFSAGQTGTVSVAVIAADDSNASVSDTFDVTITGIPNLAAYYPLDGNANDLSGHGSHGAVNGPVLTPDRNAVSGQAYLFDGTDDVISVSDTNNFRFNSQITIAAWVRADEQKSQVIFRKGGGAVVPIFELAMTGTGDIVFSLGSNQARQAGYATGTWMHIAGTYDGAMMRLYVDGIQSDSLTVADALVEDTSLLFIGTRTNQVSNTFHGAIDEIRIYDAALKQNEIVQLGS